MIIDMKILRNSMALLAYLACLITTVPVVAQTQPDDKTESASAAQSWRDRYTTTAPTNQTQPDDKTESASATSSDQRDEKQSVTPDKDASVTNEVASVSSPSTSDAPSPATSSAGNLAVGSETADDSGKNIEVYLSTDGFAFVQKLDGSTVYRGMKQTNRHFGLFCFYGRIADYSASVDYSPDDFFENFVRPLGMEALRKMGVNDITDGYLGDEEECDNRIWVHTNRDNPYLQNGGVSIVFVRKRYNQRFGDKFFEKFKKLTEIPASHLTEVVAATAEKDKKNLNLYNEVAQSGALTHIGSITIMFPADSHVQFCGYARDEILEQPLYILPEFGPIEELVHRDVAHEVRAVIERRKRRDTRYMRMYSSLDEFFQEWQIDNDCNVFVAHPQDISTFIQAARNLSDEFGFLINPIWDIDTLLASEAENRGYSKVVQIHLEAKLNVSSGTVVELSEFGIYSIDDYREAEVEMLSSGFAASGNAYRVIDFLNAKEAARAKGMTIVELLEEKRLAEQKELQRIQKIHNLETAKGLKNAAFIAWVTEDHLIDRVSCENYHSVLYEQSDMFYRTVMRNMNTNLWEINFLKNKTCIQASNCPTLDDAFVPDRTWENDGQNFWMLSKPEKLYKYKIQNDQFATYKTKRLLEDSYETGRYLFCR